MTMGRLLRQFDSGPRRILAAGLLSGGIVMSVSVFAESSYVQTRKIQIESAAGQHCEQWSREDVAGETRVRCERWDDR